MNSPPPEGGGEFTDMKKLIRLTESDLHNIIENTVRRVLKDKE